MPTTLRNFLRRRSLTALFTESTSAMACLNETGLEPGGETLSAMSEIRFINRAATQHTRVGWERAVVLSVARGIEPDAARVMHWFTSELIHEFGGKTAQQLVEEGATAQLLDMLVTIRNGHRDH